MYLIEIAIDTYSLIVIDENGQRIFLGTFSLKFEHVNGLQIWNG